MNSLFLDNDFYKLTMMYAVYKKHHDAMAEYQLFFRSNVRFTKEDLNRIDIEIDRLIQDSYVTDEDIEWLKKQVPFIQDETFWHFLKNYKMDFNFIDTYLDKGKLSLTINGPWLYTILYEVPLMAIISEVYLSNKHVDKYDDSDLIDIYEEGMKRLDYKINFIKDTDLKFVDFGTRRRFSRNWHSKVVQHLRFNCDNFIGSSNMLMSRDMGKTPIGTMAHEWLMAGFAFHNTHNQSPMLQKWLDVYRGHLGIALTDTYTTKRFLKDFDFFFANSYSGVRHDSNDPYQWSYDMLRMYEKFGIDPKTKTFVYSDNLTFPKMKSLYDEFHNKVNVLFGIGTNLTNDVGLTPLNMVIKLTEINGKALLKLSDEPEKAICKEDNLIKLYQKMFDIGR